MEQPVPGVVAQIADIAVRLEAAFNAGDAVALAALYSDTAILMPPNEPMVTGRPEIQAWFEKALLRLGGVRIVPIESNGVGAHAFQVGTFTTRTKVDETSSTAEGRSAAQAGKYVLVLSNNAGQWKIQYDIWSLDEPVG